MSNSAINYFQSNQLIYPPRSEEIQRNRLITVTESGLQNSNRPGSSTCVTSRLLAMHATIYRDYHYIQSQHTMHAHKKVFKKVNKKGYKWEEQPPNPGVQESNLSQCTQEYIKEKNVRASGGSIIYYDYINVARRTFDSKDMRSRYRWNQVF